MTNELGIVIENNRPVVSSRKVAEVFEKQHKDVMKSIRELTHGDEFGQRNFSPSSYINSQNKEQPEYLMTRDGFTLLAMGFTGSKAMQWKIKYIEAFNKMEQQIANPYVAQIPTTYAEALRLAADLDEQNKILVAEAIENQPKVKLAEAITASDDVISVNALAKILTQHGYPTGSIRLFEILRATGFLMSRKGPDYNRPTQRAMELGIMAAKEYPVTVNDEVLLKFTPKITSKGQQYFVNRFCGKEM